MSAVRTLRNKGERKGADGKTIRVSKAVKCTKGKQKTKRQTVNSSLIHGLARYYRATTLYPGLSPGEGTDYRRRGAGLETVKQVSRPTRRLKTEK